MNVKRKHYQALIVITIVIIVIIISLNCISQGNTEPYSSNKYPISNRKYEKINITSEREKNGVFDLALEYNEDGSIGWMAYSAINAPNYISTHIAKTIDKGKTWNFIAKVNLSYDDAVNLKGREIDGTWFNEVPTIVYVPNDPAKEWKLYWHKYFHKKNHGNKKVGSSRVLEFGWVAYKYAPDPSGPWSEEIPLFGAGAFPLSPHNNTRFNLNNFHPDLKDFITYTEPGSLYQDGVLYLSLQGFKPVFGGLRTKIFLLASKDKGRTWDYLGALIEDVDAKHFGFDILTASSIAEENGRIFLLVSPQNNKTSFHYGTRIYEFEDISKAKLKRDKNGKLILHKFLSPSMKSPNSGESDYDKYNTYGGIVMSQADISQIKKDTNPDEFEIFQIFNTKEKIIDEKTEKYKISNN